jgi:hypothetical protein
MRVPLSARASPSSLFFRLFCYFPHPSVLLSCKKEKRIQRRHCYLLRWYRISVLFLSTCFVLLVYDISNWVFVPLLLLFVLLRLSLSPFLSCFSRLLNRFVQKNATRFCFVLFCLSFCAGHFFSRLSLTVFLSFQSQNSRKVELSLRREETCSCFPLLFFSLLRLCILR